LERAKGIEPS